MAIFRQVSRSLDPMKDVQRGARRDSIMSQSNPTLNTRLNVANGRPCLQKQGNLVYSGGNDRILRRSPAVYGLCH
jgi:hypothetical protein